MKRRNHSTQRNLKRSILTTSVVFLIGIVNGATHETKSFKPIDTIAILGELINQENGLSQGMISSMTEDNEGYLWIGTKDGLNRFDGKKFKTYLPDSKIPNSISDGFITYLFNDSRNRLWIGTYSGGLNLFDKKTERFIHFKQDLKNQESISSNSIVRISELSTNQILVETVNGETFEIIDESDAKNENDFEKFKFYPLSQYSSNIDSLAQNLFDIDAHLLSADGSLWIFQNYEIIRVKINLENTNWEIDKYAVRDSSKIHYIDASYFSTYVKNFNNDSVIFSTQDNKTLVQFNDELNQFVPFLTLPEPYTFQGNLYIDRNNYLHSIQSDGTILKISLLDKSSTILTFPSEKISRIFNSFDYINVYVDRNDNTWLGTPGYGIIKMTNYSTKFKEVQLSGGVNRLNFRLQTKNNHALFDSILQKKWNSFSIDSFFTQNRLNWPSAFFNHIAVENNTFWTALDSNNLNIVSLFGFSSAKNPPIKIKMDVAKNNLGYAPTIIFIGREDHIWFANRASTLIGPLIKLDPKTLAQKSYYFPSEMKDSQYPFVSDWAQDNDGIFWFATVDGVFSFDPYQEKWHHFKHDPANDKSLSIQRTFSILLDPIHPDSILWVGTDGGGLNKMNKKTGQFLHYSTKDGLPNNVIYSILADGHNNLWMSTNFGICMFNPTNNEVRNFGKQDGLPLLEFNRYSYSSDKEPNLYFEGEGRIIKVMTDNFYGERTPTPVIINKLKLFNQLITFGREVPFEPGFDYKLPAPIEFCDKIILPHNAKMITLGFTLLDLTAPVANKYQYQLEGFNHKWIDAGIEQEAIYTSLNPGSYTFKVRGYNSDDVWSEPTALKIVILTPWWNSWWFTLIWISSLLTLFYAFYRFRLQQVVNIERMRNDIAQDLHDEIGSTLSSISLYSAVMQNTVDNNSVKSNQLLNKIIESTSSVMASMNDMVWTIKVDNDNFKKVINRLRAFAVDMTESRNILLEFEVDANAEKLELTMTQRKNIYLIFKEAINNSIKYSNASKVEIQFKFHNHILFGSISDNGKGFSYKSDEVADHLLGGNGISGMLFRAKQIKGELLIDSQLGRGTKITLTLKT